MTLRYLAPTLVLLATPVAADGPGGIRLDLSYSTLAAESETLTGTALTFDGGFAMGAYGVQVNAAAQRLDGSPDLELAALRLLLHRSFSDRLRLGVSVGAVQGDDPTDGFTSLGLHARYDAPGLRFGGDLIKPPDDRGSDGAFVTTAWAEQDLRPDLILRGSLYRRSTDTEDQDLAVAQIGLRRAFANGISGFGSIFTTNADDHAFYNQGVELGAGWEWTEGQELYAATVFKTGTGLETAGITVGLRLTLGDGAQLFESGPLPDLVGYGAY